MNSQPTRRTRRQEREFQANRQKMDEYVYLPSERAAAYFWQIGIGASCAILGLFLRATYAGSWFVALSTILIASSVPFMATGVGGWAMQNRRLFDYRGDILDNRRVDVEEETFHYGDEVQENPEYTRDVITNKGGKPVEPTAVSGGNLSSKLKQAFAVAVLCRQSGMSRDNVTDATDRKNNWSRRYQVISQGEWKKVKDDMIKNGRAYMERGKVELNAVGYDWLERYVPDDEVINLPRPKV